MRINEAMFNDDIEPLTTRSQPASVPLLETMGYPRRLAGENLRTEYHMIC